MELWLRTDEHEEAVSALEMVAEAGTSISSDSYRWKWVIISAHNALQGFMVLALRNGNGLLALKDNIAAQWLKAYREWLKANREGGKFPVEKLDTFLNLYKKIKSDRMLCYVHSKIFEASDDHDRSVKKLNQIRNKFIHFVPKSWLLELTGLPQICLHCLEIIQFLGWESGNILFRDNQQERARAALFEAKKVLFVLQSKYEEEAANQVNAAEPHSAALHSGG